MSSWAITGASRGIGFEYAKQLSADGSNQVFALIRNQPSAELIELDSGRRNLHIIQADVTDAQGLSEAAAKVGELTGNKLDVFISNACHPGLDLRFYPTSAFLGKEKELKNEIDACMNVNLLGAINSINCFLPLIRSGELKKIIYITSPSGDAEFTRKCGVTVTIGYTVTKAAMNLVISKYAAELKGEGIKTLALSPGWVDTDGTRDMAPTPEVLEMALQVFQKVNPDLTGLMSPEESVRMQLDVINSLTADQSGLALSHHGDYNWL
ncbi:NAD(P)-binding protein [Dothidotthia symphoricarpi CBS 119687]|uniref:NAD(P)-binding protein n=1 Tax=Dothidotthia symphoricarpi CBS 119687 TaxID=1392245 RepID=A0A6A6AHW9_9PLEO|nr:NAD(P)-binding protein [Dothidotthia symphoricarpi CBS 119687]KAF2130688.1 NAD(P)-binding protein [Dothidotthia symphoricarpi CBS 119687]